MARLAIRDLAETDAHRLLADAFDHLGWQVKNLHASERSHERGADLRLERSDETTLVAVKIRPLKSDIRQLRTLANRKDAASRLYFYLQSPTEDFRKEAERQSRRVEMGGPESFHQLMLQGEVVEYLLRVFEHHALIHDMGTALGSTWKCRHGERDSANPSAEELGLLLKLKDATLKLRAPLTVAAFRWDEELMNKTRVDSTEFPILLNRAIRDLSLIRRFMGPALATNFARVEERMPHVLSHYWSVVGERTFWDDFVLRAGRLSTREEVEAMARRFWLMPSEKGGFQPARARESMVGFYSSIVHIFQNLARVAEQLEMGVDWVLEDRFPDVVRSPRAS